MWNKRIGGHKRIFFSTAEAQPPYMTHGTRQHSADRVRAHETHTRLEHRDRLRAHKQGPFDLLAGETRGDVYGVDYRLLQNPVAARASLQVDGTMFYMCTLSQSHRARAVARVPL